MTGCEMPGIVVIAEEPSDPPPLPLPPAPGAPTAPTDGPGSGDDPGGGGGSGDCSKSGPATAVPAFLFPTPDEAPTTKRISPPDDPPSGDNPTSGDDPTSGEDCGNGEDDGEEEEPPADEPMSKAELIELYEMECGYTNPQTQDDAFEVDARYALGHSAPGEFRFPDGISQPDGVKRGVLIDGAPNYSYFRAMLEVKHKESGLLEGSQTRKYIDELARPYAELPGYETTWPPFLVIASLSTNSELRYFDDGGATLQHAKQNGINVFHVTLRKAETGQMYLKGRTVGMVTTWRNSDGTLVQSPSSDTITESYEFEVLCKAEEAESN